MPAGVDADIQVFFDSYRAAFERRDVAAIAEHFRFPLHVTGDAGEVSAVAIPAVESWIPQLERLLAGYAQLGVHTARMLETRTSRFSPRLAQAAVHWVLETSAGKPIYEFDATYTLAKTGEKYKITAIAHNEQLRAREMLAKRALGSA